MKRLGINIDHVATIRNARGSSHPDPLTLAKHAMKFGASSITIHLREDRRHIRDYDVVKICKNKKIPVNLEISLNNDILKIALKNKPNFICIVPENRKEITTEGGLNLAKNKKRMLNSEGFLSRIDKVSVNGQIFYSVRVGLFDSLKLAKKEQIRLISRIGLYDSIIIEIK